MSTKTTFKRIALVAVASLGFGVLSSVAPAMAAAEEQTISSIAVAAPSPARVGAVVSATVTFTNGVAFENDDTFIVAAKVISAPAGSGHRTNTTAKLDNSISSNTGNLYFSTSSSGLVGTATNTNRTVSEGGIFPTAVSAVLTTSSTATTAAAPISFIPDVAGTYQILISSGLAATTFAAGNASTILTITTAGEPATVVMSAITSSPATDGEGTIVKVQLKDASGAITNLKTGEALTVASNKTTTAMLALTTISQNTGISGTADSISLGTANFINGAAYFRATDSVEETVVFTATAAGALSNTITSTVSVAYTAPTLVAGSAATLSTPSTATSGYKAGTASGIYVVRTVPTTGTSSAVRVNFANTSTTVDAVAALDVTDTSGKITGIVGAVFGQAVTIPAGGTATGATATFSHALTTAGQGYSAVLRTVTAAAGTGIATTSVASAIDTSGAAVAVVGSTVVNSATGGTTTWKVSSKDQFGILKAGTPITVTISGRNVAKSGTIILTDSTGYATYTLVDAGTSGTTDSLSFSQGSSATAATATVNYGTFVVGSVTLTGGSDLETVAGSTLTAISAGDDPSTNARKAFTATVKDANGNLLAGTTVTFAISGISTAAIVKTATIDYTTVVTGSDGKATTNVFAWGPGKLTVTATAGDKSDSEYLTFGSAAATSARVLSLAVVGTTVTATVKDRYGNAVDGVSVVMSREGKGTFGNGSSTQTITTDKTGTADVQFSGSALVVGTLAATYTQAYDLAGEINAVAVTAPVAGTTTGTGSTLAPLGVYKATVQVDATTADTAQAAADAAAEATDAANAATDAANAAAEAADAATAAAQDAADAVAALSTQVSEMVNALKKQITALTNLVIKIQKKVRA